MKTRATALAPLSVWKGRGAALPCPVPVRRRPFSSAVRRRSRSFQVTSWAATASFQKGIKASRNRGREIEALVYFEAALILDVFHRHGEALPRYRSYYGLALGLIGGELAKGLELCRDAAREAPYEAELLLNLGRLEGKAGNRSLAHRAFVRGFHLADDKKPFEKYLRRLEPRFGELIPFLARAAR